MVKNGKNGDFWPPPPPQNGLQVGSSRYRGDNTRCLKEPLQHVTAHDKPSKKNPSPSRKNRKNRKNLKKSEKSQNRQKPRFSFAKIRISQCFPHSNPIFWPGRAEKNGPEIDDNFLVPAANRPTDVSAPIGHPRVISCFEGHRAA